MNKLDVNRQNLHKVLESEKGKETMKMHLKSLKESVGWLFVKAVLEEFIEEYKADIDNIDKKFDEGEMDRIRVKKVLLERLLNIPDKYIEALTNSTSDLDDEEGDPFE